MGNSKNTFAGLKYRLAELLDTLPRSVSIKQVAAVLEREYGITYQQFARHRRLRLDSPRYILESDMAKYAAFFGVSEQDLRNYKVTPALTVYKLLDLLPRVTSDYIIAKTKMSHPNGKS